MIHKNMVYTRFTSIFRIPSHSKVKNFKFISLLLEKRSSSFLSTSTLNSPILRPALTGFSSQSYFKPPLWFFPEISNKYQFCKENNLIYKLMFRFLYKDWRKTQKFWNNLFGVHMTCSLLRMWSTSLYQCVEKLLLFKSATEFYGKSVFRGLI